MTAKKRKTTPAEDVDVMIAESKPPFTAEYGSRTPGFRDWCEERNLDEDQRKLVILKMEQQKG